MTTGCSPHRQERRPEVGALRLIVAGLACLISAMIGTELAVGLSGLSTPGRIALDRLDPVPATSRPPATGRIEPYRPTGFPDTLRPAIEESAGIPPPARPGRRAHDGDSSPMTFLIGDDEVLMAVGTIVPGTADRLKALLDRPGTIRPGRLQLHSPGGSVRDAIAIARLIREYGLETQVAADGYCASSCPLVFAGGVRRTAHRKSWIGLHQVYARAGETGTLGQGMDEAQRITAQAQSLLLDLGVDPRVWIRAMQTSPDKIYLLTTEEMISFGLATWIEG